MDKNMENKNKQTWLSVRLTESQKKKYKDFAEKQGLKLTTWLKHLAEKEINQK